MKKNYNQPIVEAVEVQAASMLLDASPAGIISGGNTEDNLGGSQLAINPLCPCGE